MTITRILFSYDSLLPKFYGTRVSCRHIDCDLSDFYVIAQRTDIEVLKNAQKFVAKRVKEILKKTS